MTEREKLILTDRFKIAQECHRLAFEEPDQTDNRPTFQLTQQLGSLAYKFGVRRQLGCIGLKRNHLLLPPLEKNSINLSIF